MSRNTPNRMLSDTESGSGNNWGLSREDSNFTYRGSTVSGSQVNFDAEIIELLVLCENGNEEEGATWEAVRQWLREHTANDAREAATLTGEYSVTCLHLACRNCPPIDIVEVLLSAAQETVQWTDSFGWLPLHYACASGASADVLKTLMDAYPESRTATDKRGRTPLHFALGNTENAAMPDVVTLLASSGAAACADDSGMLPLHYAGAYGASESVLSVLTDGAMNSIIAVDKKGRTPLHFAMGNCDRDASPTVVKHLISRMPEVVNSADGENGNLPLHLCAARANDLRPDDTRGRENAQKCLELYLNGKPKADTEFLTALKALPVWLGDRAVVTPVVQILLNEKISQRFPTAVLMLDFYSLCAILATYSVMVPKAVDVRDGEGDSTISFGRLLPLYLGASYFLVREVVQVMSLCSLGLFNTWLRDPTNWVDVTFILLVYFWTVVMNTGVLDQITFQNGCAVSLMFLWLNFLSFLRSMLVDFAVFVSGVYHVLNRLVAFLTAGLIILVAFMQMFYTVFKQTSYCDFTKGNLAGACPTGSSLPYRPFCSYWTSFLKVFTMLLGEVDDNDFKDSDIATWFFVMFMFLVVILLANVLIAIVTDSYGVIRNERAAIVFWSNRLDFVAEMDAISNGPWRVRLKNALSMKSDSDELSHVADFEADSSSELWKKLYDLFEDDTGHLSCLSMEFWCYQLMRFATAMFIIPLWLLLGALSAGYLWPPQVRERILKQRVSKLNPGEADHSEQRMAQVKALRQEMKELQAEVVAELESEKTEVVALKDQMTAMKEEVLRELKDIKQVMMMLFEVQSTE